MSEKKVITKKDWQASFNLIGTPVINDYTFKIDERSEKSGWIYNSLNLGINCGEKHGTVYAEMMGGYGEGRDNKIYAYAKSDDSKNNSNTQIIVDWEDRFNDDVLETVNNNSFITVGLEKTDKGQTFYKRFLSEYDAIAYVKEHLTSDMVVSVRGKLIYSLYDDNVQTRKTITYIGLSIDSKTKQPTTLDKFKATFVQSILIDKDSASLKNIDKDKSVMYVNARVLDFLKEYKGVKLVNAKGEEKGSQYPFSKQFEFALDLTNEKQCKTILDKLFAVKKDVTQITFEGEFIEGGAVVTTTYDDLPKEIKELVDAGVFELEEACAKCTVNGNRERRMVLKKPQIKMVGDDDNKVPAIQKFEERYKEEDLILDYLYDNTTNVVDDEFVVAEEDTDNSMDWLNAL